MESQADGFEQTELPYKVRIENFEGPLDLLLHRQGGFPGLELSQGVARGVAGVVRVPAPGQPDASVEARRLLVIEDDAVSGTLLKRFMERLPWAVQCERVATAEEAQGVLR